MTQLRAGGNFHPREFTQRLTYFAATISSSSFAEAPFTNLIDGELTQWRSFVCVIPSPTNTATGYISIVERWAAMARGAGRAPCPRCPPHPAHVISMRRIPCETSSVVSTEPLKHLSNAGQPQPLLNLDSAE